MARSQTTAESSRLPPNASAEFVCDICNDAFKRFEHLSRHYMSHMDDKPYSCSTCGKAFTRRDTLNRHVLIHRPLAPGDRPGRVTAVSRVSQACAKCSQLRLRCDGQSPCVRCQFKDIPCVYGQQSRRKVAVLANGDRASTLLHDPRASASGARANKPDPQPCWDDLAGSESSEMEIVQDTAMKDCIHVQRPPSQPSPLAQSPQNEISANSRLALDVLVHTATMHSDMMSQQAQTMGQPSLHGDSLPLATNAEHIDYSIHGPSGAGGPNNMAEDVDLFGAGIAARVPELATSSDSAITSGASQPSTNDLDGQKMSNYNVYGTPQPPGYVADFDVFDWMTFDPCTNHDSGLLTNDPQQLPLLSKDVLSDASTHFESSTIEVWPVQGDCYCPVSKSPAQTFNNRRNQPDERIYSAASVCGRLEPRDGALLTENMTAQWPTDWEPTGRDNIMSFPDMRHVSADIIEAESLGHVPSLPQHVYDRFVDALKRSEQNSAHFKSFRTPVLPCIEAMDCFIQLYFEYFHPIFPLLHQPTFHPAETNWLVVLATAAIGCQYSKADGVSTCALALQELLRRSIADTIELDNSNVRGLWTTQSIVLNAIGMFYSGNKRHFEISEATRNTPITQCRRNGALRWSPDCVGVEPTVVGTLLEERWKQWSLQESRRRLGYCTFLLDAQVAMYLGFTPALAVKELQSQLPCSSQLWEAQTAAKWKVTYLKEQDFAVPQWLHKATIPQVLALLGNGHSLPDQVDDFIRLVLVFSIFRAMTGMMEQCVGLALLNRERDNTEADMIRQSSVRLLDLMKPTQLSGNDSPLRSSLVIHINLASMLLCCPREEILNNAHCYGTGHEREDTTRALVGWLTQNKGAVARLAVSHAGLLWGSLQSDATQVFFKPFTALLATLVLWTYGRSAERLLSDNGTQSNEERGNIIRLDRQRYDSDTKSWISGSVGWRPHIADVGYICRPSAPVRLLQAGCKLLTGTGGWALDQGLGNWLAKLEARSVAVSRA